MQLKTTLGAEVSAGLGRYCKALGVCFYDGALFRRHWGLIDVFDRYILASEIHGLQKAWTCQDIGQGREKKLYITKS